MNDKLIAKMKAQYPLFTFEIDNDPFHGEVMRVSYSRFAAGQLPKSEVARVKAAHILAKSLQRDMARVEKS